jgi:hypothetical protein
VALPLKKVKQVGRRASLICRDILSIKWVNGFTVDFGRKNTGLAQKMRDWHRFGAGKSGVCAESAQQARFWGETA